MLRIIVVSCFLATIRVSALQAQTTDSDDINVSATFQASIDLTVTEGANINFVIATQGEYIGGVSSPYQYFSEFTVTSSTDFQVTIAANDLTDSEGHTLNVTNFGFRLQDYGTHLAGTNHLLLGGSASPSPLGLLGPSYVIIAATGVGNAGTANANRFRIQFELGTPAVRALNGLPTLLQQQIIPGLYTGVVTLTASAMP